MIIVKSLEEGKSHFSYFFAMILFHKRSPSSISHRFLQRIEGLEREKQLQTSWLAVMLC